MTHASIPKRPLTDALVWLSAHPHHSSLGVSSLMVRLAASISFLWWGRVGGNSSHSAAFALREKKDRAEDYESRRRARSPQKKLMVGRLRLYLSMRAFSSPYPSPARASVRAYPRKPVSSAIVSLSDAVFEDQGSSPVMPRYTSVVATSALRAVHPR